MKLDPPICLYLVLRKVLLTGTPTEPSADGSQLQRIRRLFRTGAPDTKARVWGHIKSGCRVVVVGLECNSHTEYYALTGIPLVTACSPNLFNECFY